MFKKPKLLTVVCTNTSYKSVSEMMCTLGINWVQLLLSLGASHCFLKLKRGPSSLLNFIAWQGPPTLLTLCYSASDIACIFDGGCFSCTQSRSLVRVSHSSVALLRMPVLGGVCPSWRLIAGFH